jgi:acyl transferase domain-containing protein/3-hydroxymyristoyl/3-hydroxydecanoyl-(acyl carrier protein) dehydratase
MTSHAPHIAVVSMAGIFPGAGDTDRFITHILEKKQHIIQVPPHRWAAPVQKMTQSSPAPDRAVSDRAVSDRAGLVTDFVFDPRDLDLDMDILSGLDPVHHLVLSAGSTACRACFLPAELKKRTGVILASIALPTDTASAVSKEILCAKTPRPVTSLDALACAMVSGPAAVLARALMLGAGSFTLDAACASSLVAIKLACEQLICGKADVMVTGGVSRPDSLYTQIGFTQLAALSPSGRCAPFDRHADGLVVGEGCGILVLKRLADALACNDPIFGVIKGWGLSNDIAGNLVAPASEGQVRAMSAACDMAGWSPDRLQYMECHGSGTPVGDRVELASIQALLARYDCPGTPLAIGSVKSNIGHLLTAAGAAGFIKTLLAMNQKILPPSCNFTALPDNHPLEHTRVQVQTRADDWAPRALGEPRRAGISAFGFGGINAHILVEEYLPSRSHHAAPLAPAPRTLDLKTTGDAGFAIVGMHTLTGDCPDLSSFTDLVLGRTTPCPAPAKNRWRRFDHLPADQQALQAGFLDTLSMAMGEFHIPPLQMADILPQHLVLLKAAKGALADAGISPRPQENDALRTRAGCAVGIEFDFGAADFSLRWHAHDLPETLLDKLAPPLTFNRTLGALGGIAASRAAREFQLGGPCFTVSAGAASGFKAIEVAIQSLAALETDWFICASVDMAGDIRQFCLNQATDPFGPARPAEGAAALVLKRLADAKQDKDRIYAVIEGVSGGSGGTMAVEKAAAEPSRAAAADSPYLASLQRVLADNHRQFSDLSFVNTHSGGHGNHAPAEALALTHLGGKAPHPPCALGWTAGTAGDTRGASGLFSVINTALCLYHRTIPGCHIPSGSALHPLEKNGFVIFDKPGTWPAQAPTPKRAVTAAMTHDGGAAFCLVAQTPDSISTRLDPRSTPRHPQSSDYQNTRVILTTRPAIPQDLLDTVNPLQPHSFHPPPQAAPEKKPLPFLDPGFTVAASEATARAHEKFLAFSRANMDRLQDQFAALTRAAAAVIQDKHPAPAPLFTRDQCLEFATGAAGRVLGPDFDIIDTYPVRVRLPDEPLMLVDRIMAIEGEPCSLGPGKIITQHDVLPGAWYLDGGVAPVSICIEAGQADLFLCAFLGIDHVVKGDRRYRLLDAKVTFHRPLPRPGETIEYHICIDRFLKQGEVYLFFFHYQGYIDHHLFISMRDGCAGFFTREEVKHSGGIVLKKQDRSAPPPGERCEPFVPVFPAAFNEDQVQSLRNGNLAAAFGKDFTGMAPGNAQHLPGRTMHLIDRVLSFDPEGGRYGLGAIIAEADIHPDAWFLTCHFIDDPVMPGTLMYECCAHALRIFVQRMGWISPDPDVHFDVMPGNESDLKCRGPVTPDTKKARYEIEIKYMGYRQADDAPVVIADAHMFADDLRIVLYKDMGMTLSGVSRDRLNQLWRHQ